MRKLSVLFFIFCQIVLFSQITTRYPLLIMYGNGTNHFLGELGGGKKEASHFLSIRDIDYQVTRPTWQIGLRYKFHEYFALRVNYTYLLVSGNDRYSGFYARRARNLSFRSGIYELSTQFEYYFLKEKSLIKSSFGSLKGYVPFSAYLFVGGGLFYFNPKAKHPETGKWIALRPLGTEGQFANPDGTPFEYQSFYYDETGQKPIYRTPKPYSRIAACLYLGLGIKYELNKQWAIGFEISNRYTSTDYIDDVHDKYFNYSDFNLTPPSPYTAIFADRHLKVDHETQTVYDEPAEPYHSGKTMRGDPNYNDAYVIAIVTVYYKLKSTGRGFLPKFR